MEAKALAKYVRTAPRKIRLLADMIRGRDVQEAMNLLRFTPKRASRLMEKLVRSAVANAEDNDMDVDSLFISSVSVDQGPTLKRWRARAMGRAVQIKKKTSHVTVIVQEREGE